MAGNSAADCEVEAWEAVRGQVLYEIVGPCLWRLCLGAERRVYIEGLEARFGRVSWLWA